MGIFRHLGEIEGSGILPGGSSGGFSEFDSLAEFPEDGVTGLIYVAVDTERIYRWNGTAYVELSASGAIWGQISGVIGSQTDLMSHLSTNYAPVGHSHAFAALTAKPTTLSGYGIVDAYPLAGNPSGFLTSIPDGSVTLAKQAAVASGSVFYRRTVGAGSPEVHDLSALKSDLGLTGVNSGDQDLSGYLQSSVAAATYVALAGSYSNPAWITAIDVAKVTGLSAALAVKADLVGGVIPSSQIPSIAIVEYLGSVASQAAMLALNGDRGDWCLRSDLGTTWVLSADDSSLLSSWTQLLYPTAPVTSVAGRTGAVTLTHTDIGGLGTLATQSGTFSGNSSGTNTGDQDLSAYATTAAVSAGYQPLNGNLTTIAGLAATSDNFLQSKAGAWASRTVAQVKADLGLSGTNSGDQTITLTGDVTGSGTGSFAATISNSVVTNAMLAGSISIGKLAITGTPDGTKFLADNGSWQVPAGGGGGGGGIASINGDATAAQLLTVGTAGTDFAIDSVTTAGTSVFNLPNASATARGVITTGAQTIAGNKSFTGNLIVTQTASTSGSPALVTLTGAAHTTLAASTEATDADFNSARTVQWATGALATQRTFRFQAQTLAFVGASVVTTASTLSISGAPIAGTNATITNAYALNVESGNSNFGGNIVSSGTIKAGTGTTITIGTSGVGGILWSTGSLIYDDGFVCPIVRASGFRMQGASLNYINTGLHWGASLPSAMSLVSDDSSTILAVRGGATAQTFRVYNTYTSATVGEYGQQSWVSNEFRIGTAVGSAGGTQRSTVIGAWNAAGTFTPGLTVSSGGYLSGTIMASAGTRTWGWGYHSSGPGTYGGAYMSGNDMYIDVKGGANKKFYLRNASANICCWDMDTGSYVMSNIAATSGAITEFTLTAAAHTGQTASTEASSVVFDLSATKTWAAGAITTQRAFRITAPTYAFASASTITSAITLEVTAPVAGTNATFTKAVAISCVGDLRLASSAAGVTNTNSSYFMRFSGSGTGAPYFGTSSKNYLVASTSGMAMCTDMYYGWANDNTNVVGGSPLALALYFDAWGVLALRNSTNPQTFRVYNTHTSATNCEYGQQAWSSSEFRIGTAVGSAGGSQRSTVIGSWNAAGTFSPFFTVNTNGQTTTTFNTGAVSVGHSVVGTDGTTYWQLGSVLQSGNSYVQLTAAGAAGTAQGRLNLGAGYLYVEGGPTTTGIKSYGSLTLVPAALGGSGGLIVTQTVATSGSPTAFTLTGAAHTTLTLSTECTDANFDFARTKQFATGALTTQRTMRIQAETLAFVAASVVTTASTLSISGAPIAGTNATITNAYALNVESGKSMFGGEVLAVYSSPRFFVGDTAASAIGVGGKISLGFDSSYGNGGWTEIKCYKETAAAGNVDANVLVQCFNSTFGGTRPHTFFGHAGNLDVLNAFTSLANFESIRVKPNTGAAYQIGSAIGSAGGTARAITFGHWNAAGTFVGTAQITTAGRFGDTGGLANSLVIGEGSSVAANNSTAIGYGASTSSADCVAIGTWASCTTGGSQPASVSIGRSCRSFGGHAVSIGYDTNSAGTTGQYQGVNIGATSRGGYYSVAIGFDAWAYGSNPQFSVAIGHSARAQFAYSIALGYQSTTTVSYQFVCGSASNQINDVFFGKGVASGSPSSATINGTGGSGTNIVGADIIIAGGKGTGTGVGGSVRIKVAPAGSTGSAVNSLVDAVVVDSTQDVSLAAHLNVGGQVCIDHYATAAIQKFRRANGSLGSPAQVGSGGTIGMMASYGYHDGAAFHTGIGAYISFISAEAYTSTSQATDIRFATTETGATTATVRMTLTSAGVLAFEDAANIAAGTTTGTKIGTSATQKIGFWNATPIVQPTTSVAAATIVPGAGTGVKDDDTFDGYTLAQFIKAVRNTGLLA